MSLAKASWLIKASRGGRVVNTQFLDPQEGDALGKKLRSASVRYARSGGYAGASRTVLTVFPSNIPEASVNLTAVFFACAKDASVLSATFRERGIDPGCIGDLVLATKGIFVVTFVSNVSQFAGDGFERGALQKGAEAPLSLLGRETTETSTVIVPSLRVDVLGAKAFQVSRVFFKKGIEASNVTVNGLLTKKSGLLVPVDEVFAKGLGRFTIEEVLGKTRKGNNRVVLTVDKATT